LNLPPSKYYTIKASFLESTPLDKERITVKADDVTKVDIVLKVKSLKEAVQ
jgi:hypothetical protein